MSSCYPSSCSPISKFAPRGAIENSRERDCEKNTVQLVRNNLSRGRGGENARSPGDAALTKRFRGLFIPFGAFRRAASPPCQLFQQCFLILSRGRPPTRAVRRSCLDDILAFYYPCTRLVIRARGGLATLGDLSGLASCYIFRELFFRGESSHLKFISSTRNVKLFLRRYVTFVKSSLRCINCFFSCQT